MTTSHESSHSLAASATAPAPIDALLPPAMAERAEAIGLRKAEMAALPMFMLAVLAGAFIALGANVSTIVATGATGMLPFGVIRILQGIAFSLGLVLVIV